MLSSAGASILAVGYVLVAIYLIARSSTARGGRQPVARDRARVDDAVAAAAAELRDAAGGDRGRLRVFRSGRSKLSDAAATPHGVTRARAIIRISSITSTRWSSSTRRRRSGMWLFLVTEVHVLRRPVPWPTCSTASGIPRRGPRQPRARHRAGRVQHRRPDRQQLDDGDGGARRADRDAAARRSAGCWARWRSASRSSIVKVFEYKDKFDHHHVPGYDFHFERRTPASPGRWRSSSRSTSR